MYTLTIEDSNGQVADRFSFDHGSYVIGRHDECDIILPSTSVSRNHARLFIDNGRCFVEDLGSSNGILVDGQRVVRQRDLGMASQLRIGDYYLYLEYERPDRDANQNILQTLFIAGDSGHAKLVRINDAFAGELFTLSEVENTIGRTDNNLILLSDQSISRDHAKLVRSGDDYTLIDLGSSNGTRRNGKAVKGPVPLKPFDRVMFGNVEFVFAPGDAEIDPADFVGRPGSSRVVMYIGLFILAALGFIIAGIVFIGLMELRDDPAPETITIAETVESRLSALLEDARLRVDRRNWDGALAVLDDAVALAPDNPDVLELRSQVLQERDAHEEVEQAEIMVEQGRHREALTMLESVDDSTVAYTRAQRTREHVVQTLTNHLKNEATRLSRSRDADDLRQAHERVVEALGLSPGDEEALELLLSVESTMRQRRIRFEAYSP